MEKINWRSIKSNFIKRDNMLILILTGVLLLVIAWPVKIEEGKDNQVTNLWGSKKNMMDTNLEGTERTEQEIYGLQSILSEAIQEEEYIIGRLEERLEEILSSMQGVGKVQVMITLASKGEKIVEKDIPLERSNIVESDAEGGNRSTNEMYSKEETVYIVNSTGDKIPYVTKEIGVEVAGVSVVAQGGDQPLVQKNISETIQALFGIEEHKIKVVKMKYQE